MSSFGSHQKEYQELQRLKLQLNQQMRISSLSESASPIKLPSIKSERVKPRLDRYATERIRYQNNLSSVLADIRVKMDLDNSEELLAFRPKHLQHQAFRTLNSSRGENVTVKTMSLSPKK